MGNDFKTIATQITALFVNAGFKVTKEIIDPISDNGAVEMRKGPLALRLVRDRKLWFIEMRFADSDEWFDSPFVLNLVGDMERRYPPKDEGKLQELAEHVMGLLPKWEPLFRPGTYSQTKRELNERERISAREQFG